MIETPPTKPTIDSTFEPIAVDAKGAAALFCCSERHWRTLDTEGKVPCPIRIGASVRWDLNELRRWSAAGCPARLEWETARKILP